MLSWSGFCDITLNVSSQREIIMAQILVRGLDDAAVDRLKKRAEASHRSLEAEARDILETASRRISVEEAAALAARIRHELSGRQHCDSVELIRADRDR